MNALRFLLLPLLLVSCALAAPTPPPATVTQVTANPTTGALQQPPNFLTGNGIVTQGSTGRLYLMVGSLAYNDSVLVSGLSRDGARFAQIGGGAPLAYSPPPAPVTNWREIRDCSLVKYAPATGNPYYLLAYTRPTTASYKGAVFGIAKSYDLVTWTSVADITPSGFTGTAQNVWGPYWVVDDAGNYNVVLRISTDSGNPYAAPGPGYLRCTNPGTWTAWTGFTALGGISSTANGMAVQKINGTWYCFLDNTVSGKITCGYATSTQPFTGYGAVTYVTSGTGYSSLGQFEGPSVVWMGGDHFRMYFQCVNGTSSPVLNDVMYYADSFDGMATWSTAPSLVRHNYGAAATAAHVYALTDPADQAAVLQASGQQAATAFDITNTYLYSSLGSIQLRVGIDPANFNPLSTGTNAATLTATAVTFPGSVAAASYTGSGAGLTGLTKSQVGLGNVENTALSTWAGSANITTLGAVSNCPSFTGGIAIGADVNAVTVYSNLGSAILNITSVGDAYPQVLYNNNGAARIALVDQSNYNFAIYSYGIGANALDVVYGNGNVLIGTDSDDGSTKLQVNGKIKAAALIAPALVKTAAYTAAAGDVIEADTSGGAWTLTLPAAAAVGDRIVIEDAKLSWNTAALTIARNGLVLNGGTSNYTASVQGGKLTATYISAAYGWSIK